jgi:hypothetical protein
VLVFGWAIFSFAVTLLLVNVLDLENAWLLSIRVLNISFPTGLIFSLLALCISTGSSQHIGGGLVGALWLGAVPVFWKILLRTASAFQLGIEEASLV